MPYNILDLDDGDAPVRVHVVGDRGSTWRDAWQHWSGERRWPFIRWPHRGGLALRLTDAILTRGRGR